MGTDDGMLFLSLSSFPPPWNWIFRFISLVLGTGLTFILSLQFDIDDGVLWFGIESEPKTLVARQLTVRAPLLSIWEVARSQLEHVSFGLLELLPHHYDDHNEHRQQDQDATNGHSHHGAVTHLRDLCESLLLFPFTVRCLMWSVSCRLCVGYKAFAYFSLSLAVGVCLCTIEISLEWSVLNPQPSSGIDICI